MKQNETFSPTISISSNETKVTNKKSSYFKILAKNNNSETKLTSNETFLIRNQTNLPTNCSLSTDFKTNNDTLSISSYNISYTSNNTSKNLNSNEKSDSSIMKFIVQIFKNLISAKNSYNYEESNTNTNEDLKFYKNNYFLIFIFAFILLSSLFLFNNFNTKSLQQLESEVNKLDLINRMNWIKSAEFEELNNKLHLPRNINDKIEYIKLNNGAEIVIITPLNNRFSNENEEIKIESANKFNNKESSHSENEKHAKISIPHSSIKSLNIQNYKILFKPKNSLQNSKKYINIKNKKTLPPTLNNHSVVGLTVNSGSQNDEGILGLAHLTEHLLFTGSNKYQNKSYFDNFIKLNGGLYNGFTEKEKTSFVYEINRNKLLESLELFLNAVVYPNFEESSIEKEIKAVVSEHEKNLHIEEKKFFRLLQEVSNKNHSYYNFTTGNEQTLTNNDKSEENMKELRNKVIKYHQDYYVGENIKMIIYSDSKEVQVIKEKVVDILSQIKKTSLENIKKTTIKNNASSIVNRNLLDVNEKTFLNSPFSDKEKSRIIFYKNNSKVMKVFFFIPDLDYLSNSINLNNKSYLTKPKFISSISSKMKENSINNTKDNPEKLKHRDQRGQFILNPNSFIIKLLQKDHPSSLISYLKAKKLIFNLKAEALQQTNNLDFFNLEFDLTELGMKNIDLIISSLMKYIKQIHLNIESQYFKYLVNKYLKDNINKYNEKSFTDFYKSIKKLLTNFHLYGVENMFNGNQYVKAILDSDDSSIIKKEYEIIKSSFIKKIHEFIKHMTLNNSLVFIGDNKFDSFIKHKENDVFLSKLLNTNNASEKKFLNKEEKFYSIKYRVTDLSSDQIFHILQRDTDSILKTTDSSYALYLNDQELALNFVNNKDQFMNKKRFLFSNPQNKITKEQLNEDLKSIQLCELNDSKCKSQILSEKDIHTIELLKSPSNNSNAGLNKVFYYPYKKHLTKEFTINAKLSMNKEHLDQMNLKIEEIKQKLSKLSINTNQKIKLEKASASVKSSVSKEKESLLLDYHEEKSKIGKTFLNFYLLKIFLNYIHTQNINFNLEFSNNDYFKFSDLSFNNNFVNLVENFSSIDSKAKLISENFDFGNLYFKAKFFSFEYYTKANFFNKLKFLLFEVDKFLMNENEFKYLKEELARNIKAFKSGSPFKQAYSIFYRFIFKYDIDYLYLNNLIENISSNDFNEFVQDLRANGELVSLISGYSENKSNLDTINSDIYTFKSYLKNKDINVNDSSNKESVNTLDKATISKDNNSNRNNKAINKDDSEISSKLENNQNPTNINLLPLMYRNKMYNINLKALNYVNSDDSITLVSYYLGTNSISTWIKSNIILNHGSSIFFDFLRIEHQLGYLIKYNIENIQNHLYLFISVQGNTDQNKVKKLIDESLLKISSSIRSKYEFKENEFESFKKRSLDKILMQKYDINIISSIAWGNLLNEDKFIDENEYDDFSWKSLVDYINNDLLNKKIAIQVFNSDKEYNKIEKSNNKQLVLHLNSLMSHSKNKNQAVQRNEINNDIDYLRLKMTNESGSNDTKKYNLDGHSINKRKYKKLDFYINRE